MAQRGGGKGRVWSRAVVVASVAVTLGTSLMPAHSASPAGLARPQGATFKATLGDPVAQTRAATGATDSILDPPGCFIIDTKCPIDRPSSARLLPLPDADGDGKGDALSVSTSWSHGNTTRLLITESEQSPVLRTIVAGHRGSDGSLLWTWRAPDGEAPSLFIGPDPSAHQLFVLTGASLFALDDRSGHPSWSSSLASVPDLQSAGVSASAQFLGFADLTADPGRELLIRRSDNVAATRLLAIRLSDGALVGSIASPAYFALAGDLDGDGRVDLVTVDRPYQQQPVIRAMRGADGTDLWQRRYSGDSQLGFSVDPLGDLDGDGRAELAIGAGYFLSDDHPQPPNLHLLNSADGTDRFAVHAGFGPVVRDANGDGRPEVASQRFAFASDTATAIEARYLAFDLTGRVVSARSYSAGGTDAYYFGFDRLTFNHTDVDGDGVPDFGHRLRAYTQDGTPVVDDARLTSADGTSLREVGAEPVSLFGWIPALDGQGSDTLAASTADGVVTFAVISGRSGAELVTAAVPWPEGSRYAHSSLAVGDVNGDGRADLLARTYTYSAPAEYDFTSNVYERSVNQVRDGYSGALLWEMSPLVPSD